MSGFASRFVEGLALMFGFSPKKPTDVDFSADAKALHIFKKTPEQRALRKATIKEERENPKEVNTWRYRRWASILVINFLFVASYWLDLQLIEGALTASRVFGFHFADLNSSLQVMLAFKTILINLVIGVSTVLIIYIIFGGRSFCSWVCPYHLLSELAEKLHLKLVEKRIVKDHPLHRGLRSILFVVFALLAFASGYTVFETISPVGILSRALTYGSIVGLAWVGVLLLIEVVYSRRFWCRYVCPIGLTYGMAGAAAPVRVLHDMANCMHEGKCREVCLVPHVLEMTKLGYAKDVRQPLGPDCTRCGMCLDVCPTGALSFEIKGLTRRK